MYKYFDHVQKLLEDLQNTYEIKDASMDFYKRHINNFLRDYMGTESNINKPLDAITYYDLNTFIKTVECSSAEKINYYQSFKRFFDYAYLRNETQEIISQVIKPDYTPPEPEYLKDDEYYKIKAYIVDRSYPIKDRLILGLFLFTGLSRKYIAAIINSQFIYDHGVYKLQIWDEENETLLPLKSELQIIVHEYIVSLPEEEKLKKLVPYADDNYLSRYISNQTQQIIGVRYTPTVLSNTFIRNALSHGNYVWEISKLTLESITSIEKHIDHSDNLFVEQTAILNSF